MDTQNLLKMIWDKKLISELELAKITGVPQPTLSRIRRGLHKKPHLKTVQKINSVFDSIQVKRKGL